MGSCGDLRCDLRWVYYVTQGHFPVLSGPRLLAAFRLEEVTVLVELLCRIAEVMALPASNDSRTLNGKGARKRTREIHS